jgi:hypothetical protein
MTSLEEIERLHAEIAILRGRVEVEVADRRRAHEERDAAEVKVKALDSWFTARLASFDRDRDYWRGVKADLDELREMVLRFFDGFEPADEATRDKMIDLVRKARANA